MTAADDLDVAARMEEIEGCQRAGVFANEDARWMLDALAEARAEIERLRRWKDEALPVMDGLQELGRALDVPLGTRITGRVSLDAVLDLKNERDEARAAIDAAVAERPNDVEPYIWCLCGCSGPMPTHKRGSKCPPLTAKEASEQ